MLKSVPWFALHVRSRCEKIVYESLRSKGLEAFLPQYKHERQWGSRRRVSFLPLFPGYVFCQFDPSNRLPVLVVPGVITVVGAGKQPLPVDFSEIDALRRVVAEGLLPEPTTFHHVGQPVVICSGPLRGVRGIIVRHKNKERLILTVSLLQRSAAVDVQASWVRGDVA
jgi:transcription antitermination factor NusG